MKKLWLKLYRAMIEYQVDRLRVKMTRKQIKLQELKHRLGECNCARIHSEIEQMAKALDAYEEGAKAEAVRAWN